MLTPLAALALSVGLAAEPPTRPAPAFPVDSAGTSRDFDTPPPGSPADQALWRATYEADNAVVVEQHLAAKLAVQAQTNTQRLGDPESRGRLTQERAEALAAPLASTWKASVELMASIWPVSKVRGCRYELLNFESVLIAKASPTREAQLDDTRRDLNACMGKLTGVLAQVRKANEDLRAANDAAERALGPPRPAKATAATAKP